VFHPGSGGEWMQAHVLGERGLPRGRDDDIGGRLRSWLLTQDATTTKFLVQILGFGRLDALTSMAG
jgi:hypothetical protein